MKLILAISLALISSQAFADVRVHDGDTLTLDGQRIRLWGIDAPELHQSCKLGQEDIPCGTQSRDALKSIIGRAVVVCRTIDVDRYQREVSLCYAGPVEINAEMVRRGWAVDYTQYSKGEFSTEQAAARADELGIWQCRFMMPWDWRKSNRRQ